MDALLLQYIGVCWQVKLKSAFRRLFDSKAWKRSSPPTHDQKEKYEAQLGRDNHSIEKQRNDFRRANFFVSQLADSAASTGFGAYNDLEDRNITSPAKVKPQLLHIMTTDCYLNMALHGTHAIVRSDFEWFGPSLPHLSILTVLEFLGMPKTWISFYKAFLAAPVRFSGDAKPRIRKRGTPFDYELSVVCGEAMLFIMDFAVNQRTDGLYLYRIHDDLWLWDANADKCAAGWKEMKRYAGLVGMKFNHKKTGSAVVGSAAADKPSRLPHGDIRWGFLKFEPSQSRFVIDQSDVDLHIVEFRRQLAATKSVFGWINIYNKYMSFFLRNFGGVPRNCFGQEHIVDIIDTLGRIQRDLFPETGDSSAVGYLRKTLHERFDVDDLPEGYFYLPISSGGLELRNTMLEVLSLSMGNKPLSAYTFKDATGVKESRSSSDSEVNPDDLEPEPSPDSQVIDTDHMDDFKAEEETSAQARFSWRKNTDEKRYAGIKEKWNLDTDNRRTRMLYRPSYIAEFMSFAEYISLRESWLSTWGETYRRMLLSPSERDISLVPQVGAHIPSHLSWSEMAPYERWVMSMYGEEVVKKFGGLQAVDPNLIPIGMVKLFKTARVKMDQ